MSATTAVAIAPAVDLSRTADCVFVSTHFHMGIGRMRQIRDLKVETTADKSQLRHQKQLIDSPELDEIRSQDGYLTRHLNARSSKYDEATRFVHQSEMGTLYRTLVAYQTIRRPKLVADFMKKYRELEAVDFAPLAEALGDQFDRGDYPKSDVVEAGFSFEFYIRPVGKIDLDGLPSFIIEAELAKDKAKREAAVEEWKDTLRLAGQKVVDALFNAVRPVVNDGKRRAIQPATVKNLQEFLSTYNLRDLAGDAEYHTKVIAPLKELMKGVDPERLRHSEQQKAYIAKRIEEIRKDAALLVQATGRKFR